MLYQVKKVFLIRCLLSFLAVWRFSQWITVLCILCFLYSCGGNDASRSVATVNGKGISLEQFKERLYGSVNVQKGRFSMKLEEVNRLKEEILARLVDEKIMLLRAEELSMTVDDAEMQRKAREIKEGYSAEGFEKSLAAQGVHYEAWEKAFKERLILEKLILSDVNAGISVTEEEAKAYYDSHRKEYTQEMKVHVAQIILRDQEKSEKILKRLKKGEDFGKVAREVSIGLEAVHGGDLGFVGRGIMPENADKILFSLSVGAISQVIKSPYGYHIFKIVGKQERRKNFSDVKEQVVSDIRKQKEGRAYDLWLAGLRSRAVIKINKALLRTVTVPETR